MISLLENRNLLLKEANKELEKCTCQLFKRVDGNYLSDASGVLLFAGENWFLLSAGHVFDDESDFLFTTGLPNKFIRLGGDVTQNEVPKREIDKIDIAIMMLNQETMVLLKDIYTPINLKDLAINLEVKDHSAFLTYGYPATRTKFDRKKGAIGIRPFSYMTNSAKKEIYENLNCNLNENIVCHYEKNHVYNFELDTSTVGPDPYGLSGAGLWQIGMNIEHNLIKPKKKLVAILTTWPKQNRKFWISTRIDIFSEMLRNDFNCKLPKSRLVNLI